MKTFLLATHRHLPWGTADRAAYYLTRNGCPVTTIEHPLRPDSQACSLLIPSEGPPQRVPRRPGGGRRYLEDFRLTARWSRSGTPDTAVGFDALCAAALARGLRGRARVVLYLVDWTSGSHLVNGANRLTARLVDEIWCITPAIAARLARPGIRVVPNLPLRFADGPPVVPGRLADIRLGYIGHLTAEQDLTPFLQALALLPAATRPSLVIAGDGPCRTRYVRMCADMGLDRVVFTGRLTTEQELAGFYRSIHYGLAPYNSGRVRQTAQGDSIKAADYVANYRFVLMTCRIPGTDRIRDDGLGRYIPENPRGIAGSLTELPGARVNAPAADAFLEERCRIFREVCRL